MNDTSDNFNLMKEIGKERRTENLKFSTARLEEFAKYLDKAIDEEYDIMPLSPEDAIRKSSYCLALERDKNAIYNILNGRDFNYVGD